MHHICIVAVTCSCVILSGCNEKPLSLSLKALDSVERTLSNQSEPIEREKLLAEESISGPGGINQIVRHVETSVEGSHATAFFNRPELRATIFPGSMIWFDALNGGQIDVLSHGNQRESFKVVLLSADSTSNGEVVTSFYSDGTLSKFCSEMGSIEIANHAVDVEYDVIESNSVEEAITKLGMSAKYLTFAEASGSLNLSKKKKESSVVIAFKQIFFTASVDVGALPPYGGPLKLRRDSKSIDERLAADIRNRKAEIAYISDVSYGRAVFLLVRSEASQEKLTKAAKASGSYLGFGGGGGISTEDSEIMNSSRVQCVIVGSSSKSDSLGKIFTGNLSQVRDAVQEYLAQSMTITDPDAAIPLVFSARFTRDNATAYISETRKFSEWRPWKKAGDGQAVTLTKNVKIPPPGRLSGDGEMDSGDSSAEVKVGYSVRLDEDNTGLIVDVEMVATEWSKTFRSRKDSKISLGKRFRYKQLVPNGFDLEVLDSGDQKTSRFAGQNLQAVSFPSFGKAQDIRVKYDARGRNDHKHASLDLDLNLRYKVLGSVPSD